MLKKKSDPKLEKLEITHEEFMAFYSEEINYGQRILNSWRCKSGGPKEDLL